MAGRVERLGANWAQAEVLRGNAFYLGRRNNRTYPGNRFSPSVVRAIQNAYRSFMLGGALVRKSRSGNGEDVLDALGPGNRIREIPVDATFFRGLPIEERTLGGRRFRVAEVEKMELTNVLPIERERAADYETFLKRHIDEQEIDVVVEYGIGGSGNPKRTLIEDAEENNYRVLEGIDGATGKRTLYFMVGDRMSAREIKNLAGRLKEKKVLFVYSSMSGSSKDGMMSLLATLGELYGEGSNKELDRASVERVFREQVVAVTRDTNEYGEDRFLYHLKVPANSEARQAKLMYATSTIVLGGDIQRFLDGFDEEVSALRAVSSTGVIAERDIYDNGSLALGAFIASQMYLSRSIYFILGDGMLYPWVALVNQILGESLGGKTWDGNPHIIQDDLANFVVATPNDYHTILNDWALRRGISAVAFLAENVDPDVVVPLGSPQDLTPVGEFEGLPLELVRNMVNTAVLGDFRRNGVPFLAQGLSPDIEGMDFVRGQMAARLLMGGTWISGYGLKIRADTQKGVDGYKEILNLMDLDHHTLLAWADNNAGVQVERLSRKAIILTDADNV